MMSHYVTDVLGNRWPIRANTLINLKHGNCNCGKDIPVHRGVPLCPHCKCYQGKDGCNDCECLGEEE